MDFDILDKNLGLEAAIYDFGGAYTLFDKLDAGFAIVNVLLDKLGLKAAFQSCRGPDISLDRLKALCEKLLASHSPQKLDVQLCQLLV